MTTINKTTKQSPFLDSDKAKVHGLLLENLSLKANREPQEKITTWPE